MIVSSSRRTDLPAFHAEWLTKSVGKGSVEVKNPFNAGQIRTVSLVPAPLGEMEALVLWTRDPTNLLPILPEWERAGVRTLFQVTLTAYPAALEPDVPPVGRVAAALKNLSQIVGRERIVWRYDPLFTARNPMLDADFHRKNFACLAEMLAPLVGSARISVYDAYAAAERRLKAASICFDPSLVSESVYGIVRIAHETGLSLTSCCEDLASFGIQPAGCIDWNLLNRLWNIDTGGKTDKNQRPSCLCAPSVDIGTYGTCGHGCLYCYATRRSGP